MFSYVFMKILEGRPRSHDRQMDELSRDRVRAMKQAVASGIPPGTHVLEVGRGTGELAALICARAAALQALDRQPFHVGRWTPGEAKKKGSKAAWRYARWASRGWMGSRSDHPGRWSRRCS